MGRGITQNELCQKGHWVVGGSSAISSCISQCVACRKLRGIPQVHKMADLPCNRIEPSPPFSYCAVDFFGPFLIKKKKSGDNQSGSGDNQFSEHLLLYQCLESFPQLVWSSQTTSLWSTNKLCRCIKQNDCSFRITRSGTFMWLSCGEWLWVVTIWDEYTHSSHMGGTWEHLIWTVRNSLEPLLLGWYSDGWQSIQDSYERGRVHRLFQTTNYKPSEVARGTRISPPAIYSP